MNEKQIVTQSHTTNTELNALEMGKTHTECGGFKLV